MTKARENSDYTGLQGDLALKSPVASPSFTGTVSGADDFISTKAGGVFLKNTSGGTSGTQIMVSNTGGSMRAGVESSAGNAIQGGTLPYAAVFGNQGNYPTQFTTNGTARMTINNSGHVGLGTSSPTSITGAAGPFIDIQGPNPEINFHDNSGTANAMSMYYLNDVLRFWGSGATNMYITNSGNVSVAGSLSKGSGSFKISHPLPSKTETHNLVHSFIEGPQADNLYRGKVTLVDGSSTVNIDTASGMSEGTYVLLNTNTQCFTNNESGWTAVKGSVSGNVLTIEAQESCSDTISWMVIGERHDQHMIDTDWTDDDGKVIVEPLKELES